MAIRGDEEGETGLTADEFDAELPEAFPWETEGDEREGPEV